MNEWTDDQSPARDVSIKLQPSPYSGGAPFIPSPAEDPRARERDQRRWEATVAIYAAGGRNPMQAVEEAAHLLMTFETEAAK